MATQPMAGFLQPFTRVVPTESPSAAALMDLPSFDDFNLNRLPGSLSHRITGAVDVSGAGQKLLTGVAMTGQEESNWCWAAVTQAVNAWAGSATTQTDIASGHIHASGRAMACTAPNAATSSGQSCAAGGHCRGDCNDQHILSVVLTENGRLKTKTQAAPAFSYLASLLNDGLPVPCRVQWTSAGGHFVMVVGWIVDASGNQLVQVLDPATAPSGSPIGRKIWLYADFVSNYSTAGSTGIINYSYEVQ